MPSEIGIKIDNRYEVLSELGRGGMGVVYKANDLKMDRMVAIKVMTAHTAGRDESLERFLREAKSIAKLQHPNIVVVHDYGYHGDAPYIAMEYVEGMALDKLIASRANISLLTKVHYIIQVCQALQYAHQYNIVHRDVKPANIMVLESGSRVKLLDFGIARAGTASSLSRSGLAMGTTCYMSPEQTKGHKDLDARSDIFSAGIVLYELLTGAPPWTGEGDYEIMTKIINDPFPPLSSKLRNYPAGLDRVLERALAKDPASRYQTAERVAADLAELETPLKEQVLEDALVQFEQGELLRARDLVSQILRVDTRHREAMELNQKLQQIAQLQQRGERVQQLRQAAEQAIGQKQYQEALAAIEQAIAIDSANAELFHYRDLIRQELKRREDIRKKLELARKAHEINDLSSAQELVEKALEADPTDTQARMMKSALEQEKKRQQLQEYHEEASRALATRAFPQVKRWILEIEAVDPQFPQLASLRKALANAEAEEKRQLDIENLLGAIRQILKAGDLAQALRAIEAALAKFPGEVRLQRLQKHAEELRDAAQRERSIQEQIASINTLAQQGRTGDALAAAEDALQGSGGDQRFQAAVTQLRQSMEREKLARIHQEIMARARDAMRAADYEVAVQILTPARVDFPASKEIAETLRSAQEALAQKAADRLAENARKRQVADALERALGAEPAPEAQLRLAEDAARSIPGNELVEQVLLRVRQRHQQISSLVENARAAERSRNYAEAIHLWERVRKLYPHYPELEAQIVRLKRALQPPEPPKREPAKPQPPKPVVEPPPVRDFSATSIMGAAKPVMKMEAPAPPPVSAPIPAAKTVPGVEAAPVPVVTQPPAPETSLSREERKTAIPKAFLWSGIGVAIALIAVLAYIVSSPRKAEVKTSPSRPATVANNPAAAPAPKATVQPSPELPKLEMGKLSIQTNVDQVDVLVDGTPKAVTRGKSVTFSLLAGKHEIGVDKRGYTAPVQVVNLTKDRTETLHFSLAPSTVSEQPLGDPRLYITSIPGASIRIDNNPPSEVPEDGNFRAILSLGSHDLEVTKNGYETWSQKIKVKAGDSIPLPVMLKAKPVSIIKFSASSNSVQTGDSVGLQWDTKNAVEVDIQPDIGRVNPADSRTVHPTATTTYILTAKGADGVPVQQRQLITVNKPLPPLASFTGPTRIQEGGSAKLAWDTQNATEISIDPPISCPVRPSGDCEVTPRTTTSYVLKAKNAGGETTKIVEVKVDPAPKVTATPAVPPPPAENPDLKAINDTMTEYKDAIHFMDIGALKHVWPTMPGDVEKGILGMFNAKDIKAVDVQLDCKDPVFSADTGQYAYACQETFKYRYENRKEQKNFFAIFDFKKVNGKWKILDKRRK